MKIFLKRLTDISRQDFLKNTIPGGKTVCVGIVQFTEDSKRLGGYIASTGLIVLCDIKNKVNSF